MDADVDGERTFSAAEMTGLWDGFWKGGYYEGDPLDPFGESSYAQMGFVSVLHAVYQVCIKPYVTSETNVLEIGPGRGAWTKTMLAAKEIWCVDVNTPEHNNFWQHVGEANRDKVRYLRVRDFSCSDLPDDHFDVLFSFGTFCHIPVEGQRDYLRNLLGKMRKGGVATIMVADFDKYNAAVRAYGNLSVSFRRYPAALKFGRKLFDAGRALRDVVYLLARRRPPGVLFDPMRLRDEAVVERSQGAWFHAGTDRTCRFAQSVGWEVVSPDVGLCVRDPLIMLRRGA
ncbi:MAG TPA: class I SAM-dependent methyltransferase [Polyangia bacterium]|nr:class I SAM-dependent methyltransferase [Polyangia bacterium]